MSILLNADLHCHSVVSDGTLTPEALAARAHANGVALWALTDHDEIGGQHRAAAAAHALGMDYLTGTEISVTFADTTVHIVGLGFDPDNAQLAQGLAATRGGRGERAQEMAQQLAHVGIRGAFEGALRYAGNPELVSRTHFARFLVETGVCHDTSEVFRRFLTEGNPGYQASGFLKKHIYIHQPRKSGLMFRRLPGGRWLKSKTTATEAAIGFMGGLMAQIAAEHQEGDHSKNLPARRLLGFATDDLTYIEDTVTRYLAENL